MYTKVEIVNIQSELNKIKIKGNQMDAKVRSRMHNGGLTLRSLLRAAAPKLTGVLGKSFSFRTNRDGMGFEVTSSDPKLGWIFEGTKPHMIFPRIKQALFWVGALFPMAKVHHPGTKPNPFTDKVVEDFKRQFLSDIEKDFGGDK